jgi:mRNA interferase RelE/StbE
MRTINIDKSAQKELERVDATTRQRLIVGIAGLLHEPPQGDIKPLSGALQGSTRLRIGSWRIIYEMTEEAINILDISPRGDAYK